MAEETEWTFFWIITIGEQLVTIDGLYKIVEMELWDRGSVDLLAPTGISIQGKKGKLHFSGFDGKMDIKRAKERYLFTWVGNNESAPASGYGNFTCSDDTLTGRIYMHDGYDTPFVAVKATQVKKMIRKVNRSLLSVKAAEPFREWVESLPGRENITIEDLDHGCTAYLIPEFESDQQRDAILNRVYADIFAEHLSFWCVDDVKWPQNRTFALFSRWFELELHLVVADMADSDAADGIINSILKGG